MFWVGIGSAKALLPNRKNTGRVTFGKGAQWLNVAWAKKTAMMMIAMIIL